MIINNTEPLKKFKDDVIIIGSGPAGISLAKELAKKKIKCLILEAGSRYYDEDSQLFYKGEIVGDHLTDDLSNTRLRMFGGTTGHWGGTCRTLDEYDYKKWPIIKSDLNPYIKKTAEILGLTPNFREKKFSSNLKLAEFQVAPVRFGEKFFNEIKESKYIYLALGTIVTRFEGNEGKINKIELFNNGFFFIKGKIFVLATGGIENSRLLLWSKKKSNNLFDKNLPIGNFWFTHPFHEVGNAITSVKKIKSLLQNDLNYFENIFGWGPNTISYNISPTKKFMDEMNILNSCCFLTIHFRPNKRLKDIVKNLLCIAPNFSKNLINKFNKKLFCGTSISSSWEQNSEFENKIVLSNNFDKIGMPTIKIYYKKSEKVRKTARIMVEEIGKFYLKHNVGRVAAEEFLYNNEDYKTEGGGQHHMGGTKMGYTNLDSVVDKNLLVHNTSNLYILGSSVFPSGGHANPTFTIIQLAFRLASNLEKNIKLI